MSLHGLARSLPVPPSRRSLSVLLASVLAAGARVRWQLDDRVRRQSPAGAAGRRAQPARCRGARGRRSRDSGGAVRGGAGVPPPVRRGAGEFGPHRAVAGQSRPREAAVRPRGAHQRAPAAPAPRQGSVGGQRGAWRRGGRSLPCGPQGRPGVRASARKFGPLVLRRGDAGGCSRAVSPARRGGAGRRSRSRWFGRDAAPARSLRRGTRDLAGLRTTSRGDLAARALARPDAAPRGRCADGA